MRIGIIAENTNDPTGCSSVVKNLAESLTQLGEEAIIITEKPIRNIKAKQLVLPSSLIDIPLFGKVLWHMSLYYRLKNFGFDILYSFGYGIIPLPPFNYYKNTLCLTDLADTMLHEKEFRDGDIGSWVLIKILSPLHLLFVDMIVTHTQVAKKKLQSIHPNKKIIVIPLGVEEVFKPSKKSKSKTRYILHVGNIKRNKNIHNLLKAYSLLPQKYEDTLLVFTGRYSKKSMTKNYYEEITEILSAMSFSWRKKIIFLGYVNKEQLALLYQNCSVFVMPSLEEGFGIPLLEAMRSKAPLVASCIQTFVEIAGIENTEYCNPYSAVSIASSITKVLEDTDKRKLQSNYVLAKSYDWQRIGVLYRTAMHAFKKSDNRARTLLTPEPQDYGL